MIRKLLLLGALVLCFWTGGNERDNVWFDTVQQAQKEGYLAVVLACIYAVDSDMLRFLAVPTPATLERAKLRTQRCPKLLDTAGNAIQDEEVGLILGEARLFLNGYQIAMAELMQTRAAFELGNLSAEEFEVTQKAQIEETGQFLIKLEELLFSGLEE